MSSHVHLDNRNIGNHGRCSATEAEVQFGAEQDRREVAQEARRAEAELMPNVFLLQAEQALIEDEDLLKDLLSEQAFATSRLALYVACPDMLPIDYLPLQMALDMNAVWTTEREWVQIASDEIKEKWISA